MDLARLQIHMLTGNQKTFFVMWLANINLMVPVVCRGVGLTISLINICILEMYEQILMMTLI